MKIDNNELNIILDRINQWINNCDIKSSIVLGLNGAILGILITTDTINKLIKLFEVNINNPNIGNMSYLILLIISILLIITGITYLLLSILAKTKIHPEKKLITNSLIHYQTISNNSSFNEYSNKINKLTDESLSKEIISQIYINSKICTKKFKNYNKGLKLSTMGLILLVIIIILGYVLY